MNLSRWSRKSSAQSADSADAAVRHISINSVGLRPEEATSNQKFASNTIKTSKVANFYFLINCIIIFIVPDPPTSPFTSILPLLFVIVVTAIKQAYEDVLRHKADNIVNNQYGRVLRDGQFVETKWKNIKCGDIVEILADQAFPCDLVLLYAATEDGVCFITTANLDGETNLKQRFVPRRLPELDTVAKLSQLHQTVLSCEKPNTALYEFKGKLTYQNAQLPITNDNVLLRGTCLRVAPFVYGVVIYTGKETKVMLNSKFKSNKMSCIERRLNQFTGIFLLALLALTVLCFALSFIYIDMYDTHWYLDGIWPKFYKTDRALYIFIVFIFYMNLFNYILPLSMYVTIELQRFYGSQFVEWDIELYDEVANEPARANTSDLNEDLGQIEYLFSDKTGTLTENEMVFKQFAIDGVIYEERQGHLFQVSGNGRSERPLDPPYNNSVETFLENLSVCHTVKVDESARELYQASSPDEFAFVKLCARLGVVFEGDSTPPGVRVGANKQRAVLCAEASGGRRVYELLQTLEFDATRKRMSVIVRELCTGQHIVFCKGADNAVFERCVTGDVAACERSVRTFAERGWRTLALSWRLLTRRQYEQYERQLLDAYNDVERRDERLHAVINHVESQMSLLGVTGIEDRLQERVADTLEALRLASIRIWVLTGDKVETAVNISTTCRHFARNALRLRMVGLSSADQIERHLHLFDKKMNESPHAAKQFALIVDGSTLGYVFKLKLEEAFRDVAMRCEAVLCCRMSPAQKAEIVRLVKTSRARPITAAIGDGANDVSMIQEAHIGFGIYGKEGRNAARSADFSFAKFKFLRRIVLVHGYLYYTRTATLVQYFFYKNIVFVIAQLYYAFWNAFSVTSLYNSIVLTFYNITLTAAPILIFGLFEQKMPIERIETSRFLYRSIANNRLLNNLEFLKWNALGLWHSLVAFFFTFFLFKASYQVDGKLSGNIEFGTLVIALVIIIVHIKLFNEWNYKSLPLLVGYGLSLLAFILFCLLPNSFIMPKPIDALTDGQSLYFVFYHMLASASVWFYLLVSVVAAVLPDLVLKAVESVREHRRNMAAAAMTAATKANSRPDKLKQMTRKSSKSAQPLSTQRTIKAVPMKASTPTKAMRPKNDHVRELPVASAADTNYQQELRRSMRIPSGRYYKTGVIENEHEIIYNTMV